MSNILETFDDVVPVTKPRKLEDIPHWVKEIKKQPYDVRTGQPQNDIKCGVPHAEAAAAKVNANGVEYDGDGIHLGPIAGTPWNLVGFDCDDCIDSQGLITESVAKIIRTHPKMVFRVSRSGTGIHGYGLGKKPGNVCRRGKAELYDRDRYFTESYIPAPGSSEELNEIDFTDIYESIVRGDFIDPSAAAKSAALDKQVCLPSKVVFTPGGKAITTKYELLLSGQVVSTSPFVVQDQYGNGIESPSQSEMDLAFANILAFQHDGDLDEMTKDFLASSLYRPKIERADYKERTFSKAIEFYKKKKQEAKTEIAAAPSSAGEIVTQRASQIQKKKIKWLWDNRVPFGKLTIFGGNPDEGKSLVTMYMVARLTCGARLEGSDVTLPPCDVLVMAGEDDAADTIVPRLESMGADLNRVHLVSSVTVSGVGATREEREVQLDTDIKEIEKLLEKLPDVRLIVIDPVSNYLGHVNMNREQEVRSILVPLKTLAARTGISILGVMHLNKNNQTAAIHRIGGAMAFSGVARAAWLFTSDTVDKDVHMMLRIKKNIGLKVGGLRYKINSRPLTIDGEETQQPFVEWLGPTDDVADDVLTAGIMGRPPERQVSATEWLTQFLAEGGGIQSAADVISFGRKAGHAERTLRRVKDEIEAIAFQDNRRWYWKFKTFAAVSNIAAIEVDF